MTYEFSGFRLEGAVLQHNGRVVPLMPKAVETLAVLVARAPAVVTKDELIAAVWPDTFVVESSLARNISLIRKALEDHAGPGDYIETLSKRGYRLAVPVTILETAATPVPAPSAPAPPSSLEPPPLPAAPAPAPPARTPYLLAVLGLLIAAPAAWYAFFRPSPPPPPDPATLIGWHLLQKASPVEATAALRQFEEAVAANPNSASAHAGVAQTLLSMATLAIAEKNFAARARSSAQTALRLDPNLDTAHTALGSIQLLIDWNFPAAERSFQRALQLHPGSPIAAYRYSQLLVWTGRSQEALAMARRGEQADPVSALAGAHVAIVLYSQRRFEEAAAQCRRVLDRERTYSLAHYYLALSSAYLHRFDQAELHLKQAQLHPGVLLTDTIWLELRKGNRQPAEARYAEIQEEIRHQRLSPTANLLLAAALGRLDDVFAAIESGYRRHAQEILSLASDPRVEAIHADPRWPAFQQRMGWK